MAKVDREKMESWFYFRPRVYFLLTRLFKEMPTEELVRCLAESTLFAGHVPMDALSMIDQGLKAMAKGLTCCAKEEVLRELVSDYARVLLASNGSSLSLRESAYISPWSDLELRKIYVSSGIPFKGGGIRADDHIATELEFMAHLSHESSNALEIGETKIFAKWLAIQRRFLAHHLLNWIPTLAVSVKEAARTQFFQGLALFTPSFLGLDLNLLLEQKVC